MFANESSARGRGTRNDPTIDTVNRTLELAEKQLQQDSGRGDMFFEPQGAEFGNALAQESARLGNKIADKMLSLPPTIKVPMGKRLNVFVEQDLSLQPYAG